MAENHYRPDEVSPPGETLLEVLEERSITQAELAERTGRPRKTINEIVKGKAAITPETALQLEKVLDIPASFWNNREQHYREHLARAADARQLSSQTEWVDRFPVAAMIKHRWLPDFRRNKVAQLEALLRFFGIAAVDQWRAVWDGVDFRKSRKTDPYALSAWLRRGELVAAASECADFEEGTFRAALDRMRGLTILSPAQFQPELVKICAECGVVVAFVPELPRSGASGATFWHRTRPVIQLSLRYKTDDHLWFTVFHEAAHILRHGRRERFLEGLGHDDRREHEANQTAAETLIPAAHLQRFLERHGRKPLSMAAVEAFARDLGIAPGIVVGRLQHDAILPRTHLNALKRRMEWAD